MGPILGERRLWKNPTLQESTLRGLNMFSKEFNREWNVKAGVITGSQGQEIHDFGNAPGMRLDELGLYVQMQGLWDGIWWPISVA